MEDQRTARLLIEQNHYAVSIDITKAYHHIPVSEGMKPYLAFNYNHEFYRYIGMPFGIRNAPRIFTHIMRAAMTEIRKKWEITSVQYLDDILFLGKDADELRRKTKEITVFLQNLGWIINWKKSKLNPTKKFIFLGIEWNSETMEMKVEHHRKLELQKQLVKWKRWAKRGKFVPVRHLARLIGRLSQTRLQHRAASIYLSKLNRMKTQAVMRGGWNSTLRLTPQILGELLWWNTQLRTNKPAPIRPLGKSATIYTDASPRGGGGWLEKPEPHEQQHQWIAHGVWRENMIHTSNYHEMAAVEMCLKHFLRIGSLREIRIINLKTDNTTVMFDVNKGRGAPTLLGPLKRIMALAQRENLLIQANHVPGTENGIADKLSRLALSGDYQLRQEVFCRGLQELNTNVEVDLFATRQNKKVRNFVLIVNDPQALARDAFSLGWGKYSPLIHPPHFFDPPLPEKGSGGDGEGCDDHPRLERPTMVLSSSECDDQESESRDREGLSHTGKVHVKQWTTVTARHDDNVPRGRKNEEGWQMWKTVMNEIPLTDEVRETVMSARGEPTQRTHCAALARFAKVCSELKLEWKGLTTVDQLQHILTTVLDWSGRNGAKLYWLEKMRTAISVLYDYKFRLKMSDNPLVKTVIHAHALKQLPVKSPLRLKWELPQLIQHINKIGKNQNLTHAKLTQKCIALLMATTCARFTEIEQFSLNSTDPEENDSRWDFIVKIKNREYKQPIELHAMTHIDVNPIEAMKELRNRIRKRIRDKGRTDDTFWYTDDWSVMITPQIRQAALQMMQEAGIADIRPYHIKHASITWLKKNGASADEIRRIARHAPGSTIYIDNYLSEDLGTACNKLIERTTMEDESDNEC
jgi:site-specific recombinase XerD